MLVWFLPFAAGKGDGPDWPVRDQSGSFLRATVVTCRSIVASRSAKGRPFAEKATEWDVVAWSERRQN